MDDAPDWADLLGELDGIRWPYPDRAPTPHGRRLMEYLGVVGMPDVTTAAAICRSPVCHRHALDGLEFCRAHAPVHELAAWRDRITGNGRAALERMDAGEPQNGTSQPDIPAREKAPPRAATPETEAANVDTETAVKPCKTPGCPNRANTRYDRGMLVGLCDEICMPARREQIGRDNADRARRRKDRTAPVLAERDTKAEEAQPVGTGAPPADSPDPQVGAAVDGPVSPPELSLEAASRSANTDPPGTIPDSFRNDRAAPDEGAKPEADSFARIAAVVKTARATLDQAQDAYDAAVSQLVQHHVWRAIQDSL